LGTVLSLHFEAEDRPHALQISLGELQMASGSFVLSIGLLIVGLFILYLVISTAVKDGINKSVVGQFMEEQYGFKENKKSILDNDLDNDK
jgi:hypothetical protein